MSQTKLARILDLIINEDTDSASELLHDVLVEKARHIYSELAESEEVDAELDEETCDENEDPIEETDDAEKDDDAEELEEDFGGDEKEGFAADIAQDDEEIDSDEFADDSAEAGVDDEFGGEGTEEERIDDLEDQLADLRAEFDTLVSQEADEPNHDLDGIGGEEELDLEFGDEAEFGGEEEEYTDESMFEATKFQHEVNCTVDGEKDATNREAPYTKAPSKQEFGGKPVKTGKDGQGKEVDKTAAKNKDSKEDNVDVPNKDQSADLKGEGKFSGTGKNSKKPAMQTKSPLTKKPK